MNNIITLSVICLALLLQGCTQPQHTMQLGGAVQQMTAQQTYNPEASEQNGTELHGSFDGVTGVNILDVYRTHIDKPQEIKNEIQINVGN